MTITTIKSTIASSSTTTIITTATTTTTTTTGVYALGDVCGKVELTPMAIAAGRRLADRLLWQQQ